MRIARFLALAGVDSRRKCEAFIQQGEVTVNGEVARDLGRQVGQRKSMNMTTWIGAFGDPSRGDPAVSTLTLGPACTRNITASFKPPGARFKN